MWYALAIEDESVIVTAFSLSEEEVLRSLLESLPYDVPFQVAEKSSRFSSKVLEALKAIFDGRDVRVNFNLAMDHLSSYTRKVLKSVSLIPVGYVTTYGTIAKAVGGSLRAVGRALASNPFLLLIPCHRVVRADLSLSGYGGIKAKRELLRREDRGYGKKKLKLRYMTKSQPCFPQSIFETLTLDRQAYLTLVCISGRENFMVSLGVFFAGRFRLFHKSHLKAVKDVLEGLM